MASRAEDRTNATARSQSWPLDDLEVHVLYVRRDQLAAEEWRHEKMTNGHWRLYHDSADGACLTVGEAEYPLRSGAVYVIPPGLRMSSRNRAPFSQVFIHFDVATEAPFVLTELFPSPTEAPGIVGLPQVMVELGRRVTSSGFPDLAVECLAKSAVYQALAQCLNDLPADRIERCWMRIAALRPVMPALQSLQQNIGAPTTNAQLAALCHMSEDYFIRRFRETAGVSPAQYILKRRIALAAQRLLFTDESIDEIAQNTGFTDRFYFSRVFARETGVPPAKYRHGPRT